MIQVYIIGNKFRQHQNEQLTVDAAEVRTVRECLMRLPREYEELKKEIVEGPGNTGWSLMLEGELLDPQTDLDCPVQAGQKLYIFCHMQPDEITRGETWPGSSVSPGKAFRQLLDREPIVVAPGAYNALTARLAETHGFRCVHVGGNGISSTFLGLPDLDFATRTEILAVVSRIAAAVRIPVIADADTGYGNQQNVWHTVTEFEQAGVAGIHLEDQEAPKRCGFMEGKQVIPREEMVKKIRAARQAASDPDFFLIARTDAVAPLGFEEAVARARCYLEAGAEMIFVDAPETEDQIQKLPELVDGPLLINMAETGKGPLYTVRELQQMGYQMVIYPITALLATVATVNEVFQELARCGTTRHLQGRLYGFKDLQRLLEGSKWMPKEV